MLITKGKKWISNRKLQITKNISKKALIYSENMRKC